MYKKVSYDPIECPYCGAFFVPKRSDSTFCSKGHYKKYTERKYHKHKKGKCDECGFVPVTISQLDVDHIDGNHKNNNLSNLQTLCANCHRLKTAIQLGWYIKKAP